MTGELEFLPGGLPTTASNPSGATSAHPWAPTTKLSWARSRLSSAVTASRLSVREASASRAPRSAASERSAAAMPPPIIRARLSRSAPQTARTTAASSAPSARRVKDRTGSCQRLCHPASKVLAEAEVGVVHADLPTVDACKVGACERTEGKRGGTVVSLGL